MVRAALHSINRDGLRPRYKVGHRAMNKDPWRFLGGGSLRSSPHIDASLHLKLAPLLPVATPASLQL